MRGPKETNDLTRISKRNPCAPDLAKASLRMGLAVEDVRENLNEDATLMVVFPCVNDLGAGLRETRKACGQI